MAVVYQHRRKDTDEVFYVGIGDSKKRAYTKRSRNRYWKNIVNSAGYEIDVLFEGISWEQACEVERGMIESYGRKDLGLGQLVNMTDGGEGAKGLKRPDLSINQLGHLNHNYGRKGELNPLYGRKRPDISDLKKGKKRPDLSKRNSQQKGKSNGRIGESHPLWGKKGKDSKRSKPLMHVQSGLIFCSVTDAANHFGIKQSTIYFHIKKEKFIYI